MKTAYRTMDRVSPAKIKIPNYTMRYLLVGFYTGAAIMGALAFGNHSTEIQFRMVPDLFVFILGSVGGWFLGSLTTSLSK